MNIHRPGELSMTSRAETRRSAEINQDFKYCRTGCIEIAVFVLCRFFMAHPPPSDGKDHTAIDLRSKSRSQSEKWFENQNQNQDHNTDFKSKSHFFIQNHIKIKITILCYKFYFASVSEGGGVVVAIYSPTTSYNYLSFAICAIFPDETLLISPTSIPRRSQTK